MVTCWWTDNRGAASQFFRYPAPVLDGGARFTSPPGGLTPNLVIDATMLGAREISFDGQNLLNITGLVTINYGTQDLACSLIHNSWQHQ